MRTGVLSASLAALLLATATTPASAADRPADVAKGKSLIKEGDRLADQGKPNDAVLKYKLAFEELLPGMRKIPFKSEVKRDVTAREDLKAFLIKEIDSDMTPEQFRANEQGMKALGFIPKSMDWKKVMVQVYSEEIAAFYDPRTKTMHLIKEPEAKDQEKPAKKKSGGFLESLLGGGKKKGFDKDENKTVIAHELTHALADQNYDIAKMQKAVKDNDDQSLALSALIEGEATLTMIGAQMEDWTGAATKELPASTLDSTFSLMMPFMPMMSGPSLREAPAILSEGMLIPYLRGMIFCAQLANDGGWDAISKAYENPPVSTEQILHPEKYKAKLDLPTTVDLGTLEPGAGWKEIGRNVVGEAQISILLRSHGGRPIAAGWDGDRFAVFEGPEGKLGLVWFSTWDTERDAEDFARQYTRFQTSKIGDGVRSPDAFPDSIRRPHAGKGYAVERRGMDVVVVEGFPIEVTESILETAFRAKKAEFRR